MPFPDSRPCITGATLHLSTICIKTHWQLNKAGLACPHCSLARVRPLLLEWRKLHEQDFPSLRRLVSAHDAWLSRHFAQGDAAWFLTTSSLMSVPSAQPTFQEKPSPVLFLRCYILGVWVFPPQEYYQPHLLPSFTKFFKKFYQIPWENPLCILVYLSKPELLRNN